MTNVATELPGTTRIAGRLARGEATLECRFGGSSSPRLGRFQQLRRALAGADLGVAEPPIS